MRGTLRRFRAPGTAQELHPPEPARTPPDSLPADSIEPRNLIRPCVKRGRFAADHGDNDLRGNGG